MVTRYKYSFVNKTHCYYTQWTNVNICKQTNKWGTRKKKKKKKKKDVDYGLQGDIIVSICGNYSFEH